jgi:methionyl-tRNA synthetase
MSIPYFITTAIDYVNGRPHLGHAYEKILADVLARYQVSLGRPLFFLTGADEHGQKVQQSAQKLGVPPQVYCDEISAHFRSLWDQLEIGYSCFARTTEEPHQLCVRRFLQQLYDKGEIYQKTHRGFYSARQEQFVTEKDMVDGAWPEIFGEVVETEEPNYFFKMAAYQEWLRAYVQDHPEWIQPAFRRNEVLAALEKPLNDLCISRPKSRLTWGISLPFDEAFVTYVWFDALVNYVSFAGEAWPADLHIIGKDILIPAHAVYWPIMLRALGLAQPKQFLVHGWWLNRGTKMSKSLGNSIDPLPYLEKYGTDAFRYFMMREMSLGQDADFTDDKFSQRYLSDLANDLGNLAQRSLSMLHRYRQGIVPVIEAEVITVLEQNLHTELVVENYQAAMDQYKIHDALAAIWSYLQQVNQYIEQTAPFKLAKDPTQALRLDAVLAHLIEALRRISVLIAPVLPQTARRLRHQLALPEAPGLLADAAWGSSLASHQTRPPEALFPRIESEVVSETAA